MMNINKTIFPAVGAVIIMLGGAWWFKTRDAQAFFQKPTPTVTMVDAVNTVLAANPGTAAIDVNLEHENNRLAWEVELNNNLEVYVDANTKKIVKTEQGWNLAEVPFLGEWIPN